MRIKYRIINQKTIIKSERQSNQSLLIKYREWFNCTSLWLGFREKALSAGVVVVVELTGARVIFCSYWLKSHNFVDLRPHDTQNLVRLYKMVMNWVQPAARDPHTFTIRRLHSNTREIFGFKICQARASGVAKEDLMI